MGSWSLASPAEAWPGHGLVALGLTWGPWAWEGCRGPWGWEGTVSAGGALRALEVI